VLFTDFLNKPGYPALYLLGVQADWQFDIKAGHYYMLFQPWFVNQDPFRAVMHFIH
jgi:hypothetical protein